MFLVIMFKGACGVSVIIPHRGTYEAAVDIAKSFGIIDTKGIGL